MGIKTQIINELLALKGSTITFEIDRLYETIIRKHRGKFHSSHEVQDVYQDEENRKNFICSMIEIDESDSHYNYQRYREPVFSKVFEIIKDLSLPDSRNSYTPNSKYIPLLIDLLTIFCIDTKDFYESGILNTCDFGWTHALVGILYLLIDHLHDPDHAMLFQASSYGRSGRINGFEDKRFARGIANIYNDIYNTLFYAFKNQGNVSYSRSHQKLCIDILQA